MTGADPGSTTTFPAAPLDARARGLLVGWLSAWFVLVAALLGWSLAGGGLVASAAAVVAGTVLPLAVLVRLAGFPTAYELHDGALTIRRHLGAAQTFAIRRPVSRDRRARELRRRGRLLGSAYGCRVLAWPTPGSGEKLLVATTDLERAVRLACPAGAVLVTPADPEAFLRAARALAAPPP